MSGLASHVIALPSRDVDVNSLPPGVYSLPPPPPRDPEPPLPEEPELFLLRDSPEFKQSLALFNAQESLGIDLSKTPYHGQALRGGTPRAYMAPFVLLLSPQQLPAKAAPGWYKIPEDEGAANNMWECTVRLEGEEKDRSVLVVFMRPVFFV